MVCTNLSLKALNLKHKSEIVPKKLKKIERMDLAAEVIF